MSADLWLTSGLRNFNVRLMSFSDSWRLAEAEEGRSGESLTQQPIHSMLASNAGLDTRGLCDRRKVVFRNTQLSIVRNLGCTNRVEELRK
jgi:hypothetical protein